MTKYFDQGGLSEEEFRAGIHAAVQSQHFIPLFCTSAEINVGVARLMDFIAKYGSSPVDRKRYAAVDADGRRGRSSPDGPRTGRACFQDDGARRILASCRFSAFIPARSKPGWNFTTADRKITERIGQIYLLNGRTAAPADDTERRATSARWSS